jgi:hypothetical protein
MIKAENIIIKERYKGLKNLVLICDAMDEFAKQYHKEQLTLTDVRFELPDTKEIESRLKHVVDEIFEDFEVVEKREYSLGFRACFNWLKIKQMKSKGN